GPQYPGSADGRLSRVDASRRQPGQRGDLYRAVPDGVWDQLLPRRERRGRAAHLDRFRGGGTHEEASRRARRRRISRFQSIEGTPAMMHTAEMLKAFAEYRENAIVVPGRGGRYWTDLTTQPSLDVPLGDPAMGGHAGFALGLALARPEGKVILFDSEGDLLMGLGTLVAIAEQQPANFYHFLIDNGC